MDYFKESWKDFRLNDCDPDLIAIQISSFGRVRQKRKNHETYKFLTKFVKANNFNMFYFKKIGNKHASFYVHRAVAILFMENPDDKKYVIHLDHDASNNQEINLKWADRSELSVHQQKNPKRIGIKTNSKLNAGKVRMIKRKLFDPKNKTRVKMIAKQFGISTMQVWRIKSGENWSEITDW